LLCEVLSLLDAIRDMVVLDLLIWTRLFYLIFDLNKWSANANIIELIQQ
jgi:hypothetical protein